MKWQGLRVPVIILSLLAGVGLIFGAQWLYQKYSFQEPLNAALSGNQAVESFQLTNEGRLMQVSVVVKPEEDLMNAYKEIQKTMAKTMGNRPFQLILKDNRDDVLEQVWYNSQYSIYQAISQGSYQEMADVINREARASGVEAKVYVDKENIYVRLKHQDHTLDQVISRDTGRVPGNVEGSAAGGGNYDQRN